MPSGHCPTVGNLLAGVYLGRQAAPPQLACVHLLRSIHRVAIFIAPVSFIYVNKFDMKDRSKDNQIMCLSDLKTMSNVYQEHVKQFYVIKHNTCSL